MKNTKELINEYMNKMPKPKPLSADLRREYVEHQLELYKFLRANKFKLEGEEPTKNENENEK